MLHNIIVVIVVFVVVVVMVFVVVQMFPQAIPLAMMTIRIAIYGLLWIWCFAWWLWTTGALL